ncbi:hypothetical protein [Kitasatospora sp. NPDC056531]|uniref:hypothetical protein n=1 Tax=Kitasatospora sp. NPDC056531 TaxID=3345856 RepID=UPI00369F3594
MTPPPPPPAHPPTVGTIEPEAPEWWRKSGPWSPRASAESVPVPPRVDLGKSVPADAVQDQPDTDEPPADDENADSAGQASEHWGRRVQHNLHGLISQTPEEQAENARRRHENRYRDQGETDEERDARHQREQRSEERHASILWRQSQPERTQRFRRWCVLTAASAIAGYNVGAIQLAAHLPLPVGLGALIGTWWVDLRLRGLNPRRDDRRAPVRVSEVRGAGALTVLIIARIPVASAMVGVLGLAPLITILSTHH